MLLNIFYLMIAYTQILCRRESFSVPDYLYRFAPLCLHYAVRCGLGLCSNYFVRYSARLCCVNAMIKLCIHASTLFYEQLLNRLQKLSALCVQTDFEKLIFDINPGNHFRKSPFLCCRCACQRNQFYKIPKRRFFYPFLSFLSLQR